MGRQRPTKPSAGTAPTRRSTRISNRGTSNVTNIPGIINALNNDPAIPSSPGPRASDAAAAAAAAAATTSAPYPRGISFVSYQPLAQEAAAPPAESTTAGARPVPVPRNPRARMAVTRHTTAPTNSNSTNLSRRRGRPAGTVAGHRICTFCSTDPVGKVLHRAEPCDWQDGTYPLECSNCADYRTLNSLGPAQHQCQVRGRSRLFRKYSCADTHRYDQAVHPETREPTAGGTCCARCHVDGRAAAFCDVDPILGYRCSRCKPADRCELLDGRVMEDRPNVRQGVVKWFRHACDGCAVLGERRTDLAECSWLSDRTAWGSACERCRANNLACLSSAMVVGMPAAVSRPVDWRPRGFLINGWAELRPNTVWRKACTHCSRDKNHCRASIAQPYSACGRCTALGLDCVDADGTAYPIFDLSQVGFGNFLHFTACRRCTEMGRSCDRQRPCDSCTAAGECFLCDDVNLDTSAGKKRAVNCFHGRLTPTPGALYYLAHGYGANGVDDVKDGSKMEHWIGPFVDSWSMPSTKYHSRALVRGIERMRQQCLPPGIPPHAVPGSILATIPSGQLTGDQIAEMIKEAWPEARPINTEPNFAAEQQLARELKQTYVLPDIEAEDDSPTPVQPATATGTGSDAEAGVLHISNIIDALAVMDTPDLAQVQSDMVSQHESNEQSVLGNGGQNAQPVGAPGQNSVLLGPALQDVPPVDTARRRPAPVSPTVFSFESSSPCGPLPQDTHAIPGNTNGPYLSQYSPSLLRTFLAGEEETIDMNMDWQQSSPGNVLYGVNPFHALPLEVEQQQQTVGAQQQGDQKSNPRRWRHLNPLHGFTRLVVGLPNPSDGNLRRKPFTMGLPYLCLTCPVRNTLHTIPEPQAENPQKADEVLTPMSIDPTNVPRCGESALDIDADADAAYLTCGHAVHPSHRCASTEHGTSSAPAMICDKCVKHGVDILVDWRHQPLTAAEIKHMRSYLCEPCAALAGSSPQAMLHLCHAGVNAVYGGFPGGGGGQGSSPGASSDVSMTDVPVADGGTVTFNKARPLTGCACGIKMLRTRQCHFHRIENAEAVLQQVAAVREWRIQMLQEDRCASCLVKRPAADAATQERAAAETATLPEERLRSWVCLACGGWVINQPGKPGLVAGWLVWFDPPPASLEEVQEEADGQDFDMIDA